MSGKIFFKNYKSALAIFAIFFICLSISIHLFHNYFLFRLLRGIICYASLIYLLAAHGRNIPKWMVGFLFFYGASSITTLWYENGTMASVSMVLNFIAFLMPFFYILPKFSLKEITKTFTLLFILMVVINGYLFIQLLELMKEMTLNSTQYIFMVLSACCGTLLAFLALFYNHYFNNPKSMAFTLFIFLLVFAEIFRGIGYYNLAEGVLFVYLGRIFLVFSLFMMVHFSFLDLKTVPELKLPVSKD